MKKMSGGHRKKAAKECKKVAKKGLGFAVVFHTDLKKWKCYLENPKATSSWPK